MEKSDIRYQLWHSLEMHTLRRDILLFIICLGLPCLTISQSKDTAGASVLMALILVALLTFYIVRIGKIFHCAEYYVFCKGTLCQPRYNPYIKMYAFTAVLEMPEGDTKAVDTHAIFATHGIFEPLMEDYVGKTATIAYNPLTDMVVVIG